MKSNIIKSIGAIVAGLAAGALLSVITDKILEKAGALQINPFAANPAWLIGLVLVYRTAYNTAGAYLAARLAPFKPMKHALILGCIGFAACVAGAMVMWHVPPHWYPISLALFTPPAAWLGGKLAGDKIINNQKTN